MNVRACAGMGEFAGEGGADIPKTVHNRYTRGTLKRHRVRGPSILKIGGASIFEGFWAFPSVLFSEFSILCHFCHVFTNIWPGCTGWVSLNLAALFTPAYCQLGVKSFTVDLLHLMCRSHVQSGSPQLNNMLANLTDDHLGHPPM